jgi:predicted nucleic acid-binding protein
LNIFLDSSVVVAASLSNTGASRQVFDLAPRHEWSLVISPWVLREVRENLRNRRNAAHEWKSLRARVVVEKDEFSIGRWCSTLRRTSQSLSQLSRAQMFFLRSTGATSLR